MCQLDRSRNTGWLDAAAAAAAAVAVAVAVAETHNRTPYPRFVGPLKHQAPERLLGLQCSYASDVYSVGLMLRTLATGRGAVSMLAGCGKSEPILTPLA